MGDERDTVWERKGRTGTRIRVGFTPGDAESGTPTVMRIQHGVGGVTHTYVLVGSVDDEAKP